MLNPEYKQLLRNIRKDLQKNDLAAHYIEKHCMKCKDDTHCETCSVYKSIERTLSE